MVCLDVQRDSLTRGNITIYVSYYIFLSCTVSLIVPRTLNCVFKEPWTFSVY